MTDREQITRLRRAERAPTAANPVEDGPPGEFRCRSGSSTMGCAGRLVGARGAGRAASVLIHGTPVLTPQVWGGIAPWLATHRTFYWFDLLVRPL